MSDYEDKHVFVSGVTSNQLSDLDLFDKTFLLQTSVEELRKRRSIRKDGGDAPDDESDFGWHDSFEKGTLEKGAVSIDATRAVEKVVDEILKNVGKNK